MNWSTLLNAPMGQLLWKKKQELHHRATHKPAIGATICCAGLRMSVQAGLSDDLWQWLVSLGWRELATGENRLQLKPLATTQVTRLFDAQPVERERVLTNAIRQVTRHSTTKSPERVSVS